MRNPPSRGWVKMRMGENSPVGGERSVGGGWEAPPSNYHPPPPLSLSSSWAWTNPRKMRKKEVILGSPWGIWDDKGFFYAFRLHMTSIKHLCQGYWSTQKASRPNLIPCKETPTFLYIQDALWPQLGSWPESPSRRSRPISFHCFLEWGEKPTRGGQILAQEVDLSTVSVQLCLVGYHWSALLQTTKFVNF